MSADAIVDDEVRWAVDKYIRSDADEVQEKEKCVQSIVKGLIQERVKMLDLVVHLERPLNDTGNPTSRRYAVRLLSECLGGGTSGLAASSGDRVPPTLKLNFKHVDTFANFFCSKLHDWQCVEGAIAGLVVLLKRYAPVLRTLKATGASAKGGPSEGVDPDDAEPIVTGIARTLFREVHTPSHTQSVRKTVLDLVLLLLQDWPDEVSRLTGEHSLGEGVSSAILEERDPRNLLLSFSLVKRLFEDFPPECVPNEPLLAIFGLLTSYFPINFTPPKNDKFGITGDDLRNGLSRALASSTRMAEYVVPFFLDSASDLSGGDSASTIQQAMSMLGMCLESYGPEVAKSYLSSVIKTAKDQLRDTITPCPQEFASIVRKTLTTALRGTPAGLHPHWVDKLLDAELADWATMAITADDEWSLARSGSRKLLLAAGAAHALLLERVWKLVMSALQRSTEVPAGADGPGQLNLPSDVLPFLLELVKLAEPGAPMSKQLLAPKMFNAALSGSYAATLKLRPPHSLYAAHGGHGHSHEHAHECDGHGHGHDCDGHGHGDATNQTLELSAVAFELLGRLCRLAEEDVSKEAFEALGALLLPEAKAASQTSSAWVSDWQFQIQRATDDEPVFVAVHSGVHDVIQAQASRAKEFAAVLAAAADAVEKKLTIGVLPSWLPGALPRLIATAGMSLAKLAATPDGADGEAATKVDMMFNSLDILLLRWSRPGPRKEAPNPVLASAISGAINALASSLESPGLADDAARFAASRLASVFRLPSMLPDLCFRLLGPSCPADLRKCRAAALRGLLRAMCVRLPGESADALRGKVLESVASANGSQQEDPRATVLSLVPAALPEAATAHWPLCKQMLPTLRGCMTAQHALLEPLALEALGCLIEAAPTPEEVEVVLSDLRSAFGDLLQAGGALPASTPGDPSAIAGARGAARCWATAASALLRKGGLATQAASFLEALLSTLEQDGPVTPFVPLALLVMMPPEFESVAGKASTSATSPTGSLTKLPPLALQQLSITTLPSLLARAQAVSPSSERARFAALESATALLCALPAEVACADESGALRWCSLTGLKSVAHDVRTGSTVGVASAISFANSAGGEAAGDPDAVFAVQVLQLLLRACIRNAAWVEDDLHSLVPPLLDLAAGHRVPLVRLASLQVLRRLVEQSYGHLTQYKRLIEVSLRRCIGDRRREVRLVAVACLNAWHCGLSADD